MSINRFSVNEITSLEPGRAGHPLDDALKLLAILTARLTDAQMDQQRYTALLRQLRDVELTRKPPNSSTEGAVSSLVEDPPNPKP